MLRTMIAQEVGAVRTLSAVFRQSCCVPPLKSDSSLISLYTHTHTHPPTHAPLWQGFTSIYSGLSAAIARQASYGTARIGLHRTFSDLLLQRNEGRPLPFVSKAASGMLAGSLAVCIGTPMDVALVRMQVDIVDDDEGDEDDNDGGAVAA
jgi:hypothetical protein